MAVAGDTAQGAASGASMGSMLGPWGALAGGVIGGAISFFGSSAKAAEMRRVRAEEDRRRRAEMAQKIGEVQAGFAASGADTTQSISTQQYLTIFANEQKRQVEWASRAAARGASTQDTLGAIGLASDIGKSVFGFAKDNNFWKGA